MDLSFVAIQNSQPKTGSTHIVALVEHVQISVPLKHVSIADHVRIPTRRRDADASRGIASGPRFQIVRHRISDPVSSDFILEVSCLTKREEHVETPHELDDISSGLTLVFSQLE